MVLIIKYWAFQDEIQFLLMEEIFTIVWCISQLRCELCQALRHQYCRPLPVQRAHHCPHHWLLPFLPVLLSCPVFAVCSFYASFFLSMFTPKRRNTPHDGKEILATYKCSIESREIHLAAGWPPGSRGCDSLFQPPLEEKTLRQAIERV